MTGEEFRAIRESLRMSREVLGQRWGIKPRAIYDIEHKDKVKPQHADAIRFVALEHRLKGLVEIRFIRQSEK